MKNNEALTYMKGIYGKKKVMNISELLSKMKVSIITVRRKLKQCGGLTSYNKNGMYYTLPNIPSFNDQRLWQYHDIRFSEFGNLNQTIVGLIAGSDAGLSAEGLSDYLGCAPHYLLHQLTMKAAIKREKLNGKYIYFSIDDTLFQHQIERHKSLQQQISQNNLSNAIAVRLLIEKIKKPTESVHVLVKTLRAANIDINEDQVNHFFEKHRLEKKTADLS